MNPKSWQPKRNSEGQEVREVRVLDLVLTRRFRLW